MRKWFRTNLTAALIVLFLAGQALAQQAGFVVGGTQNANGISVFNVLTGNAGQILVGQGPGNNPSVVTMSGDCTITAGGVITCPKSQGANFGTGATANIGTSGATVPLLNTINTWGVDQIFGAHIRVGASAPVLSACGTSPSIVGDDTYGEVTMGTASPTGCVITFASAYAAVPLCQVSWQTNIASMQYTVSSSAITLVQTATSSNKANYNCRARNAG